MISIEVPSVLAAALGDRRNVELELPTDPTIRGILDELGAAHPLFARRVRDERGEVRRYVNVFIGQENIRSMQGLDSLVPDGERVLIMQSVAGG